MKLAALLPQGTHHHVARFLHVPDVDAQGVDLLDRLLQQGTCEGEARQDLRGLQRLAQRFPLGQPRREGDISDLPSGGGQGLSGGGDQQTMGLRSCRDEAGPSIEGDAAASLVGDQEDPSPMLLAGSLEHLGEGAQAPSV